MSSNTTEKKVDFFEFCTILIRFSILKDGYQSLKTAGNVKKLIHNLLGGTIEIEEFSTQLQKELKFDCHLIDFLKKNLPLFRQSRSKKESIDGIRPRPLSDASVPATDTPTVVKNLPVDASTQTEIELPTEKLINDFADIFKCEKYSDVIIRVKDEDFRLHRNILACRSPYFRSMFETEMKEKTPCVVIIDDCKVDTFRNYALFLYTGKVEEMTIGNVCDLYEVAVKYKEDQLKEECLCFIKTKMSVESFCDFIVLALKHDDKELLQSATDLFCRQTIKIIEKNVKWQTFMTEYPAQANELYIKAHKTVEHRLNNDEVMSKKRRMNDNDI